MKNLSAAITLAVILTASTSLWSNAAAGPPLILEEGKAKAERVHSFSGISKAGSPFLTREKSVIMNQEDLEARWKAWKLGEPPKVDFTTQVVTVATWTGSRPRMLRWLDETGHLQVGCGGGTKDLVDGVTYVIEVYTLSGVNTVNGKPWPEPTPGPVDGD